MSEGCAECKHWDKPRESGGHHTPEESLPYEAGWRVCGLCQDVDQWPSDCEYSKSEVGLECGMMAFDASDYFAGLLTSPTFRCIHWAGKV